MFSILTWAFFMDVQEYNKITNNNSFVHLFVAKLTMVKARLSKVTCVLPHIWEAEFITQWNPHLN